MTVMRSQVSRISPRLCDTKIIDVPNCLPSPFTSSTMPASTVTSSAVVGSSSKQQRRLRQQRHGDDDALLLAAGKLVRIGAHHALGVRQAHGAHGFERALVGLLLRHLVVQDRHFHQLLADLHRRVQAGHRLLVDHGDLVAADGAQLLSDSSPMSLPLNLMRPPTIFPMLERSRMMPSDTVDLPQPGFADDAHRLAGHHRAGKVHDGRDLAAPREEGDRQVLDLEDRFGVACPDAASFIGSLSVNPSSIARAARRQAG